MFCTTLSCDVQVMKGVTGKTRVCLFCCCFFPPSPLSLKLKSTLHLCSLLPSLSPCEILSSFTSLLVCHFSSYWSMHTWVKWYKLLKAGARETNLIHDRSIINFIRTCKGLSLTGVKQIGIGLEVYFSVSLWQSFLHFDKANGTFTAL